jgi:hypothetical protein
MCCGHVPERVINANGTTIMWDVPAITDRTVLANRPDIILHEKKEKTWLPINITLPDASNANKKETEKLSKYEYVQRPGDRGQQDEEIEDKNCAIYNWSIRNN